MAVRDFRELQAFQYSIAAAKRLFLLSKSWPAEERFSLTDQIRRSSRSVSANIAEAWGKRRYPAAFTLKLSDADAESRETIAWLQIARDCGYLPEDSFRELLDTYDGISARLHKMMTNNRSWGFL